MKIKILIILAAISVLASCAEIGREAASWMEISEEETIPGQYHFLESDGTKIFLPKVFKRYSLSDMQKVMDSLLDGAAYEFEVARLNDLKDEKGEFYIFYDEESGSSYLINTLQYMPMSKDQAQELLGFMKYNSNRDLSDKGIEFEKLNAVYSGVPEKYIFKAQYKLSESKKNKEWYHSSYIVTSNMKTVYIQLVTGFKVDFDPYITKTIL